MSAKTEKGHNPNGKLNIYLEVISGHLAVRAQDADPLAPQQEGINYEVIAQNNGIALNFHGNTTWSLRDESGAGFHFITDVDLPEKEIIEGIVLPTFAKLMHTRDIASKVRQKDGKSLENLAKHVAEYARVHRTELRSELTARVVDALGRGDRVSRA